jgi:long-chain acyl-CoA synthetase
MAPEFPWLQNYDEGVPYHLEYPDAPLFSFLQESAKKYPDNIAVYMVLKYLPLGLKVDSKLTYRQLDDLSNRFAAALRSLGLKEGDKISVMLPNTPQYVIAYFGILKMGGVVVNTNPTYTARELVHQMEDSGATAIVTLNTFYPKVEEAKRETGLKHIIVTTVPEFITPPFGILVKQSQKKSGDWVDVTFGGDVYSFKELLLNSPATPPDTAVGPDDVAVFQYTGGTTGVPKAAVLTHRNLMANALQVAAWLPDAERGKEITLGALPFFHVYGMTVAMNNCLALGGKLIVMPDPRDVDLVLEIIHRERVTLYPGVPAMYIAINHHPRVKEYNLKSLKACISGAAPLPVEVQTEFERITGARLVEGYGLSEASPVTHSNPVYGKRKKGSIGVPFPDTEAKVVTLEPDENGNRREVPVGEAGELAVKGPQVMKGYWNMPEETALVLDEEGWLYTGDVAKMDEDGFFYIVDRKKDIIIASGYNIVPREVEEVLYEHPKVQEAVVAGVPDPYRGETVKAYIVLKAGQSATPEEIIAFCKERLAPYKVPKLVEFRSELPKSQVGKFLRRVLVEEEKKKLAAQKEG